MTELEIMDEFRDRINKIFKHETMERLLNGGHKDIDKVSLVALIDECIDVLTWRNEQDFRKSMLH